MLSAAEILILIWLGLQNIKDTFINKLVKGKIGTVLLLSLWDVHTYLSLLKYEPGHSFSYTIPCPPKDDR